MADMGNSAFPPFDSTTFPSQLLWFAIIFGGMYYYLSTRFLPKVGQVLQSRRAQIAKDFEEAAAMKAKADVALAEQDWIVAQARAQAYAEAKSAQEARVAAVEAKRQELEAKLRDRLAEADVRIAQAHDVAMGRVADIAQEVAEFIVERLVGERLQA